MEAEEKAEWVSLSGQAAGFPLGNLPRMRTGTVSGGSAAGRKAGAGVAGGGLRKREEDAMTLREMSVEYRAQAQALRGRMQELEKAWKQTEDPAERANLEGRIWTLEVLWRETRDQAVLLERYYERGYHRNEKYTL